jgi:hypothetical protein
MTSFCIGPSGFATLYLGVLILQIEKISIVLQGKSSAL